VKTGTSLKILFILQPTAHITVTGNSGYSKYRNKEWKERDNEKNKKVKTGKGTWTEGNNEEETK
jgi:hypothetical protein